MSLLQGLLVKSLSPTRETTQERRLPDPGGISQFVSDLCALLGTLRQIFLHVYIFLRL